MSTADGFLEQSWEELYDEVYKASSLFFSVSFTHAHKHTHPRAACACIHKAMVNRVIEEITQAGVGLALHRRMQRLGWCQSITYQRIFLILFIKKKPTQRSTCSHRKLISSFTVLMNPVSQTEAYHVTVTDGKCLAHLLFYSHM